MSARLHRAPLFAAAALVALHSTAAWSQQAPIPAPIDQVGQLAGQRLQIEAGTEGDTASISLQLFSRTPSPVDIPGRNLTRHSNDRFSLVLSTPWNGEDDAQPATLDGLANGTKLTLRWGRFVHYSRTDDSVPPVASEIRLEAEVACVAAANSAYEGERRRLTLDPDSVDPAVVARRTVLEVRRDLARSNCTTRPSGGHLTLIGQYAGGRLREYVASQIPRASHEFGFEASIGRNGFEFVDPATLQELSETKVQWSAKAYFSQYFLRSRTAFTLSAGYERAYEAADERVFCPANPNNIVIACTTAHGGPPELNESLVLSAGLRHQFDRGILANMAVAPLVSYDAIGDTFAADLPIYFIPNADGGLSGGLRFGYRSDRDDEFSVGVFIGAAFNILN